MSTSNSPTNSESPDKAHPATDSEASISADNTPHAAESSRRWWPLLLAPALIVAALDQLAKALVVSQLFIGQSWTPIPALANFFAITRSANSGAAFSIFQGGNAPLLVLSIAMAVGIVVFAWRMPASHAGQRFVLGILLGGVLGNALDRLRLGTVVDFIHWQIPGVISNVSNLADHAIVFSVVALLILQLRSEAKAGDKRLNSNP